MSFIGRGNQCTWKTNKLMQITDKSCQIRLYQLYTHYIYICMYVQESNSLLCIAYVNVHLTRYHYNLTIMKSQVCQNQPLTTGLNNKSKATFEIEQCWIFAVLWRPLENFQCRESIQVIIIYLHMKFRWNRTMLNLCGIVAAILKMATGRNFSMSGINSGHHYLPIYQILMTSDNVEFLRPFWKWRTLEIFLCQE